MTIEHQFNSLHDKLQLLLKEYKRVQKENERLQKLLLEKEQQHEASVHTIRELEEKMDVLKMAAGEMSDKDRKIFEKRINSYIKDLEKCIAALSE